jgi:hypothetical protein
MKKLNLQIPWKKLLENFLLGGFKKGPLSPRDLSRWGLDRKELSQHDILLHDRFELVVEQMDLLKALSLIGLHQVSAQLDGMFISKAVKDPDSSLSDRYLLFPKEIPPLSPYDIEGDLITLSLLLPHHLEALSDQIPVEGTTQPTIGRDQDKL